jgi:hypothetical protein
MADDRAPDRRTANTPLLNALAQAAATIYAARLARGEEGVDAVRQSAADAISVMLGVIDATRDLDEMLRSSPPDAEA